MTKTDCLADLKRRLLRTSDWRLRQTARFPADMRNGRAANELLRLATSAETINDEQWEELRSHFDPDHAGWQETVAKCARDVSFRSNPESFAAFVENVIQSLTVPALA